MNSFLTSFPWYVTLHEETKLAYDTDPSSHNWTIRMMNLYPHALSIRHVEYTTSQRDGKSGFSGLPCSWEAAYL